MLLPLIGRWITSGNHCIDVVNFKAISFERYNRSMGLFGWFSRVCDQRLIPGTRVHVHAFEPRRVYFQLCF
jgi:hypothetical protein